jgi:hypothetical protein
VNGYLHSHGSLVLTVPQRCTAHNIILSYYHIIIYHGAVNVVVPDVAVVLVAAPHAVGGLWKRDVRRFLPPVMPMISSQQQ